MESTEFHERNGTPPWNCKDSHGFSIIPWVPWIALESMDVMELRGIHRTVESQSEWNPVFFVEFTDFQHSVIPMGWNSIEFQEFLGIPMLR